MKIFFTLSIVITTSFCFSQKKMEEPTKVVVINNEGNPIKPLQKKNVRQLQNKPINILKSDLKKMPKDKRKQILQQPENYIIIED